MIICDFCKRIPKGSKNAPFDISITVTKLEEKATVKKGGREIINIPMCLCDACLTVFNQRLGQFCRAVTDPPETDRGIDDPDLMANKEFVSKM